MNGINSQEIINYVEVIVNRCAQNAKNQGWSLSDTIENTNQNIRKFVDYLSVFMEVGDDIHNGIINVFPVFESTEKASKVEPMPKAKALLKTREAPYSSQNCGSETPSYGNTSCGGGISSYRRVNRSYGGSTNCGGGSSSYGRPRC